MSGAVQSRAPHLHTACRPVGLCWGRPGGEALVTETLLPYANSCKVLDKTYTFTRSTTREPSPLWVLEREPPATETPAGAWGAGVFPLETWGVGAGRGAVASGRWAQVQPPRVGLSSLGTLLNPPSCDAASVTADSCKFPIRWGRSGDGLSHGACVGQPRWVPSGPGGPRTWLCGPAGWRPLLL